LVIVDYAMPGLSGAEMVRELRLRRPDLPILFASGYAETAAIEAVLDANTAILKKPFDVGRFHEAIIELLGKPLPPERRKE
jgi:CheY-like chemotaxis protein